MYPSREFKARPLNRKMLTSVSKLPNVAKRDKTEIKEFSLSRTNRPGKENHNDLKPCFKARPLDKKILEVQQFKPILNRSNTIEVSPFNLKLEERARSKSNNR